MNGDRERSEDDAIAAVRVYFEQEVREAGSHAPKVRPIARRSRSVPGGLASIAALAVVVILAATAMRVVVMAPGASASPRATTNEAPPTTPVASSSPAGPSTTGPVPADLPGTVTLNGSSAWMLLDSGISLSNDAGRTWATVPLPADIASSAVKAVATAPNRPIWLAVQSGDGYLLYRKANATVAWSSVLLTPSWTLLPSVSGPADMVMITPGPGNLITVAETQSGGSTGAVTSLFISTDDGASFVQHPPHSGSEANMYWKSVTFTTPQTGLVIDGPDTYPHNFLHTTDGGSTWSESRIAGLPEAPNYEVGAPFLVGSDIAVPVTIFGVDTGATTFILLVSHDGGASFAPQGVAIPAGSITVGTLGQIVWLPTGSGIVEETADGGQTWTAVTATGLPINVSSLALTSPTSATAVVIDSGCEGFKTNCYYRNYLVATTDGGRTWTRL
jgi:photosystem II stability/assembly factor-like uncharacterized protein